MHWSAILLLATGLQAPAPPHGVLTPRDSVELHREARNAQSWYERRRRAHFPRTGDRGSGTCDEHLGRFCLYHDGDEDTPLHPDPAAVTRLRNELLGTLDRVSRRLPGDRWVLGQIVLYYGEAGRWSDAWERVRACSAAIGWWCPALRGFVKHGMGAFVDAEVEFGMALAQMDSATATEWRSVEDIVDRDARDLLGHPIGPDDPSLRLFWRLADPLLLVRGNDRLTEHYARRVMATMRGGATNPWGLSWGDDLEEMNLRYGWERTWERVGSWLGPGTDPTLVGHHAPGGREWVPPGRLLWDVGALKPGEWIPEKRRPRSSHTPPYARDLLPADGQIALFARGDSVAIVVATHLPDPDRAGPSAMDSDGLGPIPWSTSRVYGGPVQLGAFAMDPTGDVVLGSRFTGLEEASVLLRLPAGAYVISAESWSPAEGRGGRIRGGVRADTVPPDLTTLSDLLLFDPGDGRIEDLESAVSGARTHTCVASAESLAVGWEMWGLGWRPEEVELSLSLYPSGRGFFGRVGRWLGLGRREAPLSLSWTEPGPVEIGPWFRWSSLDLPELDPGDYTLRLEVRLQGRDPLVSTRELTVGG